MQIRIDHHEAFIPIDTKDTPDHILEVILDIYTAPEVPEIINEALRTFQGLCDAWNQREMAERRAIGIDTPEKQG